MNKNAMTAKDIGKILFDKRESLKLTVEEVNRRTLIHLKVIRDIENGVFDTIDPIYLKSFLKKYSDFLGLDTADIVKKYEAISSGIPRREFYVGDMEKKERREKKEKKRPIPGVPSEKKMQVALVVFLSAVLVVLLFVLIVVMKAAFTSPRHEKIAAKPVKTAAKAKTVTAPAAEPKAEPKSLASRIKNAVSPTSEAVSLTLKAQDEAWVQVKYGDQKLFDGILKKGESRTWDSEGTITVWTGKANMLEFTVNKHDAGVVAAGVVKNIKVSAEGIRIGDTWAKRFK